MGGMIPLTDASRQPRSFPAATIAIIVANVLVFVLELIGGVDFVRTWTMIPAEIVGGRHWVTLFTAMFMHAGWMHIIGNMVFLWAFGPAIEDAMGRLCYLAFYLVSGLAAAASQIAAAPTSAVPNLGASGAIAGVMGAFLTTYPGDQIRAPCVRLVRPYCVYSRCASDRTLVRPSVLQSGRRSSTYADRWRCLYSSCW
jgi:membrane associated rhomboid family serine protease